MLTQSADKQTVITRLRDPQVRARFRRIMESQYTDIDLSQNIGEVTPPPLEGSRPRNGKAPRTIASFLPTFQPRGPIPTLSPVVHHDTPPAKDRVSAMEKFKFMESYANLVIDGVLPAMIVAGDPGVGKTYRIERLLAERGFRNAHELMKDNKTEDGEDTLQIDIAAMNCDFVTFKGYMTPWDMFNNLYKYNGKLIIWDDCDKILDDPKAISIGKAALVDNTRSPRFVTWGAKRPPDDHLPSTFEFTGKVIFITNKRLADIDSAITSRCLTINISFTADEKIELISQVAYAPGNYPEFSKEVKNEVLAFLTRVRHDCHKLSFRTFEQTATVRKHFPADWEKMAITNIVE